MSLEFLRARLHASSNLDPPSSPLEYRASMLWISRAFIRMQLSEGHTVGDAVSLLRTRGLYVHFRSGGNLDTDLFLLNDPCGVATF